MGKQSITHRPSSICDRGDETDWLRHVDYIHYNPVKHGHVKQVADRPYSTFHRYVRLGLYPQDWAENRLDDPDQFGEA